MMICDYPPLSEQDMVPKLLNNRGTFGRIYRVSESANLVAKIPIYESGIEPLTKEYILGQALFIRGISVPKSRGMCSIRWDMRTEEEQGRDKEPQWYLSNRFLPGFVMEQIRGMRLDELLYFGEADDFHRANDLLEKELAKAEALGFKYEDIGLSNAFYLQAQDRIVLFDFECWDHPDLERWLEK